MSTDTELTENIFLEDDIEDDVFIMPFVQENIQFVGINVNEEDEGLGEELLLFPEELNGLIMPFVQENIQFVGINVNEEDEGLGEELF
jgi:hypothetical protein